MTNALKILKQYWNYDSFRAPQEEIINSVISKKNVIALLPTGGGKSICFQVPAMLLDGICIVISPLTALMQDQVNSLSKKGIKALNLPTGKTQDELVNLFDNLHYANYKFLYLSPERLQSTFIQKKIKQLPVNVIAIDEAHCISEWGHDFRPSYRNTNILKAILPTVPIIALTATATQQVIEDITGNLELENVAIFKKSFFRENLAYQWFTIEDKLGRLVQICRKNTSPVIIYVNSRNKTIEIARFLKTQGFSACFYHGGLSSVEKQEAFENWMTEATPIIVATNAFGMGIDKDNVKVVVHLDLPNSLENYVQEAGRAGRNNQKAFSVVLFNDNDVRIFKERLSNSLPTIKEIKQIYKSLFLYFQIANGELANAPFNFSISEFSNNYNFVEQKVLTTFAILQNNGIISLSDNYNQKSTVQFLASSNQVIQYADGKNNTQKLIQLLLRSYGGIFEQKTKINEYWLSKKLGILSNQVTTLLEKLHAESIIEYVKANSHSELYFLLPREDDRTINSISKNIHLFIQQKIQKATKLLDFSKNDMVCRNIQILNYFDEPNSKPCNICDVCISKKVSYASISDEILLVLKRLKKATSKELCTELPYQEHLILVNLQELLSEEKIQLNHFNQYYIS
ncbi:MAG: RecQ family ATP-dependent DNA helicase [Flavobacteriaceae bacterium]|nr:RecQ family ATP-dependent DNA helicase [Flavobacteriaceae bacterium]